MGVEGETMTVFSTRKSPRLKGFDYSFPTAYFITICTHEKVCLFGQPERLNRWGEIADRCVGQISVHYSCVTIEKHVVMPNHVHMLLFVDFSKLPDEQLRPNITSIVGKYKAAVSREIHRIDPAIKVWQRSFHDHIPRSEKALEDIWHYIDDNPRKWDLDRFYME